MKEARSKRQERRVASHGECLTKNRHFSKSPLIILSSCFFLLSSLQLNAQCAMCRAALEGDGNASTAEAVNDGIVYLMAIPYILVAAIGYYVYKTQAAKKKK